MLSGSGGKIKSLSEVAGVTLCPVSYARNATAGLTEMRLVRRDHGWSLT